LDKLTEDNLKSQTTNPNNKKITITKIDNLVKSQKTPFSVIPSTNQLEIQCFQKLMTDLDPGESRGDYFLRVHQNSKFQTTGFRLCK